MNNKAPFYVDKATFDLIYSAEQKGFALLVEQSSMPSIEDISDIVIKMKPINDGFELIFNTRIFQFNKPFDGVIPESLFIGYIEHNEVIDGVELPMLAA